jgi:Insulin/IGF/Relaxin family
LSLKSLSVHNNDLSYGAFDLDKIGAQNYDDYLEALSAYNAMERGDRLRREPREPLTITEECCINTCYKYQLVSYCKPLKQQE